MTEKKIEEQTVTKYLLENPGFFERHNEVLAQLQLPHPSGGAVSLIEKQVSVLRERNTELRRKLTELLANARENDRIFDLSKRLILSLIECNDLGDLVDALYYSFDKEFNIPFAKLVLLKPQAKSTNASYIDPSQINQTLSKYLAQKKPGCVTLAASEIEDVFGAKSAKDIGSAALAVLHYKEPLGVLVVGHSDPDRYSSGIDTIFLSHIAEVLNRLITRHLNDVV